MKSLFLLKLLIFAMGVAMIVGVMVISTVIYQRFGSSASSESSCNSQHNTMEMAGKVQQVLDAEKGYLLLMNENDKSVIYWTDECFSTLEERATFYSVDKR